MDTPSDLLLALRAVTLHCTISIQPSSIFLLGLYHWLSRIFALDVPRQFKADEEQLVRVLQVVTYYDHRVQEETVRPSFWETVRRRTASQMGICNPSRGHPAYLCSLHIHYRIYVCQVVPRKWWTPTESPDPDCRYCDRTTRMECSGSPVIVLHILILGPYDGRMATLWNPHCWIGPYSMPCWTDCFLWVFREYRLFFKSECDLIFFISGTLKLGMFLMQSSASSQSLLSNERFKRFLFQFSWLASSSTKRRTGHGGLESGMAADWAPPLCHNLPESSLWRS